MLFQEILFFEKETQELKNINEKQITSEEAWQIAKEAVRKYGFYKPKEAKESMPVSVWKAINMIGGYTYLCHSKEHDTYLRSQFIKSHNTIIEEEKER